jgi:hypothetical protein
MAWFRRSRGQKTAPSGQKEHPVYGLTVGMNKAAVADCLGPPPKSVTEEQYFSQYQKPKGRVVIGEDDVQVQPPADDEVPGARADSAAWLYEDTPAPGQDIQISIVRGVLENAKVVDTRARKVIWSLA